MRHQIIRIFIAAARDWGVVGPFDLWTMAGFDDSHATQYLSRHFSREVDKFDLAEIMSKAINDLAGEEMSDAAGARLRVLNSRIHDLMTMFSVDSDSSEADHLRQVIMDAARDVVAENYGGEGAPGEGEGRPAEKDDVEGVTGEQPPREGDRVSIVPRDPEMWAKYLRGEGDEDIGFAIEKWLQQGSVLILTLDGDKPKPMLFDSEASAEAWLAEKGLGPLGELPQAGARPPSPRRDVGQERPPERRREDVGQERPPERRREETRPQPTMPPGLLPKMRSARELVRELASIRGSIESQTGFDFDPWRTQAAYSKMTETLGGEPMARPVKRAYDPPRDDPMLDSLQGLLHDMLERRGELDAAGMNTYPLQYLNEDLYEFLERHVRSASCDVLRRRPNGDMTSRDGKKLGAKGIALNVLKKEAIQLSKGNIRATKGGTITIDPGLMNCPVVREVMRQLETKASDMQSVRKRLDDLGMLVTQGEHGQVQVYCLVRSENEGGASTKMCQWFIDAHGNDGKFKIECAKD